MSRYDRWGNELRPVNNHKAPEDFEKDEKAVPDGCIHLKQHSFSGLNIRYCAKIQALYPASSPGTWLPPYVEECCVLDGECRLKKEAEKKE